MFGYVMINKELLSEEDSKRFGGYYCGLCRMLGIKYGTVGRLTLSYEMTFLAILLSSLYDPETASGTCRCIMHPKKKHFYLENTYIEYAADMTVVLMYNKALDDWKDDKSIRARTQIRAMQQHYDHLKSLYPRQLAVVKQAMEEVAELEASGCKSLDPLANATGKLLGEMFVYKKDIWANNLREIGAAMGRFIYLMDAYDDLEEDRRKGSFNPLLDISNEPEFEERVLNDLQLLIGEGTIAFEQLPLVEELPLLRNILYSGIWTKYQMIQRKRHGEEKRKDG